MGLLDKYGVAPSAPAPDTGAVIDTSPTPSNAGAGLLQKYGVTPEAPARSQYASTRGAVSSEMLKGAARGAERTGFGLVQTTLEGLAKVGAVTPELRDRFTSWAADKLKDQETGDVRAPLAKDTGEVLGDALTFVIGGKGLDKIPGVIKATSKFVGRMLTSAGIGAGTGATQFIPPDSDETRLHAAEVGAAGGAVMSAVTEPLRAFGTKLINKQFIKQAVDIQQRFVAGYDQNARTTAQSFQMGFGRINLERQRLNGTRDTLGDRIFPTVDASPAVSKLTELKDSAVNKSAQGVIQRAIEALGTPKGMEEYKGVSEAARKQIETQVTAQGPPINYSRVVKVADELDTQLKTTRKSGEATDAIESAKEIVDDFLGKLEGRSPQLRAASRQADTYEKNVYQSVARDEFKDLRKEGITPGDFHDANKKAVDIATGDNPKLATDLYNTLTPSGRESLKQGIVYRALDQAMDSKTKVIDPDKVATFLRSGSVKTFFPGPQDQQVLKGLENLTHVGSKWAFTSHAPGASLMLWGGYHAMAGHVEAGMSEAAIGAASLLLAHNAASILRTQSGVNFLRAVGKMNPDSPAAVRAFNSFMTVGVGAVGGGTNASEQAFGAFGQ